MGHPLVIDDTARKRAQEIKAYAAAHPTSLEMTKKLAAGEAPPSGDLPEFRMHIFDGFRVVYTQEYQPDPVGLCHHLSVSVSTKNRWPNTAAVGMIMEMFGMGTLEASLSVFKDHDNQAINVLSAVNMARGGTA